MCTTDTNIAEYQVAVRSPPDLGIGLFRELNYKGLFDFLLYSFATPTRLPFRGHSLYRDEWHIERLAELGEVLCEVTREACFA